MKSSSVKFFYIIFFQLVLLFSLSAQTKNQKDSLTGVTLTDSAFIKVEIESTFPGGEAAWARYLKSSLVYPPKAVRKKVQGIVVVQFIVGKDGSISDIEAIDGPELLREAAVKVIKDSPNWKPAVQFGKKVKSYKKQPINFRFQ